jgi:hypothetical protein
MGILTISPIVSTGPEWVCVLDSNVKVPRSKDADSFLPHVRAASGGRADAGAWGSDPSGKQHLQLFWTEKLLD